MLKMMLLLIYCIIRNCNKNGFWLLSVRLRCPHHSPFCKFIYLIQSWTSTQKTLKSLNLAKISIWNKTNIPKLIMTCFFIPTNSLQLLKSEQCFWIRLFNVVQANFLGFLSVQKRVHFTNGNKTGNNKTTYLLVQVKFKGLAQTVNSDVFNLL